ncbi:MAG: hypothetical protein HPY57_13325 [Ignavibacteria bacterium]|nr:hypothetical protein [Bacteroidales bacterium]NPV12762.1 hypothetical protein [Ignavibacteria bacterium]
MEDLRVKEKQKELNKRKLKGKLIAFWNKKKWWIISIVILSILIIFPSESGQAIGQWIHDFVGNLVKYSKF